MQRRTIDTNSREIAATLVLRLQVSTDLKSMEIYQLVNLAQHTKAKLSHSVLYNIVENTSKADPTHQMQAQST